MSKNNTKFKLASFRVRSRAFQFSTFCL